VAPLSWGSCVLLCALDTAPLDHRNRPPSPHERSYATVIVATKITHFANAGIHISDELSRAVLMDLKLLE
jgi:hypothetical protein